MGPEGLRVAIGALCLLIFLGLATAVLDLPATGGLALAVEARLAESGVGHPVTAVLLNFRAWDTLLELAVLWLALLGAWSLGREHLRPVSAPPPAALLDSLARGLAPIMLLVAAYLLWRGAHAPGGAFQAGAVLAAGGVLLTLAGHAPLGWVRPALLHVLASAGLAVFLGTAAVLAGMGLGLLEFPPGQAGWMILLIEAVAAGSIGVTLTALFVACGPAEGPRR